MQIEQTHRVSHRRATAPDFERDVFLPHAEFTGEPRVALRFLDRIEIGALQIFNERKLENLQIGRLANNDGDFGQPYFLRRTPAPFPRDQFMRASVELPDDERLDNSVLSD